VTGATLRVATFNIRTGRAPDGRHVWPLRRRRTLAAVHDLDADVLGLQEVLACQRRWLLARLDGVAAHGDGRGARGDDEACPVLTRAPIRVVGHRTRWFGPEPGRPGQRLPGARHPRIATIATVEVPGWPGPIDVTNVHLDAASADLRARSADQLVGWLDPRRPQVVLGDLNARPHTEPLVILAAAGLRSALAADAPGTFHRFTGRHDGPRIDHVLVDHRLTVIDAAVVTGPDRRPFASDHWPVVVDLAPAG
jgi:endonuclease/exonuclease/phosphatase family metal-dependent hydrolase